MSKKRWTWPTVAGMLTVAAILLWIWLPITGQRSKSVQSEPAIQSNLQGARLQEDGFLRVTGPIPLEFPRDHGAHPDFQTEWWYYTGNLEDEVGRRYGFQLTFFRRALVGPTERSERPSAWAADQVYLAHFALSNALVQKSQAFERLERGAMGLAGATGEKGLRVWLRDWVVEEVAPGTYRLLAAQKDVKLDLLLTDKKGVILQGDQGYSQKGPGSGNASVYFSQPRLEAIGTLWVGGSQVRVKGLVWMDHEFSTSALSEGQVGWDWFSLQLDDGSELMVYTIRRSDGSIDPYSQGLLIEKDGSTRRLEADDFEIRVEDTWRSPHSGGLYPAGWEISIPEVQVRLKITPLLEDQELNLNYVYWEGAVKFSGERDGVKVGGRGYVELTGYAGSFEGEF